MAYPGGGLRPAVDFNRLMMMMINIKTRDMQRSSQSLESMSELRARGSRGRVAKKMYYVYLEQFSDFVNLTS